jgi:hypothetical protein
MIGAVGAPRAGGPVGGPLVGGPDGGALPVTTYGV